MLTPTVCRTFAPRGQTPIHYSWDRRDRISAISAITVNPKQRRLGLYFHLLPDNEKGLIRGAAEQTVDGLWHLCGQLLDRFTLTECYNYLQHCGCRYT